MKISYECSDLIEELEQDIEEFGDIDIHAIFEKINDNVFIVDYDISIDKIPSLEKDQSSQILKASKVLEILENQNSII